MGFLDGDLDVHCSIKLLKDKMLSECSFSLYSMFTDIVTLSSMTQLCIQIVTHSNMNSDLHFHVRGS